MFVVLDIERFVGGKWVQDNSAMSILDGLRTLDKEIAIARLKNGYEILNAGVKFRCKN